MRARHGVGHGVESQTWPFRSAPCLSIRQVRHCAIVRSARLTSRNCMRDARKPVDMWTTQARCPQTHRIKNNKSKRQFDCFGSAAVRPRYVTSPTVSPDSRDTSTLHCAIFTRIQTAIHICYIPPMFRAKAKSRFVFPDKRKRAIACPSRAICVSKRLSKAAPAPNPRNCGLDSLSVSVTLSTRIRYSVYTAWSASSLAQQTHSKRSCRASVKCHCFAGASERRRLCN